jgi:hypothetical protein
MPDLLQVALEAGAVDRTIAVEIGAETVLLLNVGRGVGGQVYLDASLGPGSPPALCRLVQLFDYGGSASGRRCRRAI